MKFKQIVLFGICAFRFCSWYPNEFPVNWDITPITFKNQTPNTPYFKYTYIYHDLYVEYGRSYNVN